MPTPLSADGRRAQSAIEFLTTYGWTLLAVGLTIAVVFYLVNTRQTPVSSSCNIEPGLSCSQLLFVGNGSATNAIIVFTNNLGVTLDMPANSFRIADPYTASIYKGNCFPTNAPPGATLLCRSAMTSMRSVPVDTEFNPTFYVNYRLCPNGSCNSYVYNTTGTGTTFTTFGANVVHGITLSSSTTGAQIAVDGVPYPSGTVVAFLANTVYDVDAIPPSGYIFSSWSVTTGMVINSTVQQSASLNSTLNGTLTASFTVG